MNRARHRTAWMEDATRDLRQAVRAWRRHPGFALASLASCALGVGGITAIFSVVHAVMLRPLPYPEPGRLVVIQESHSPSGHGSPLPVNAMHFLEWQRRLRSFESLAIGVDAYVNLTGAGEPERIGGARISSGYFSTLRVTPQIGRDLLPADAQPGAEPVALISDALWLRKFQRDPAVIGRSIHLDGAPYRIAGVLPRRLSALNPDDLQSLQGLSYPLHVWLPLVLRQEDLTPVGDHNYGGLARLRPGVSVEQAAAELNALQAALAAGFPIRTNLAARVTGLQEHLARDARLGLWLLLAAALAILLIVCANLANLQLVRAAARSRDLALRAALGAGGSRLFRQALTESLSLALLGGAFGVALAYLGVPLILASAPGLIPRTADVRVDTAVMLTALAAAILCGLLFGLAPALRAARADAQQALTSSGRSLTAGRESRRLHATLVALEAAMCAACLIVAGLLLNSFIRLMRVDRGFAANGLTGVTLSLPPTRYPLQTDRDAFLRRASETLASIPGVEGIAICNRLPVSGEGANNFLTVPGTTVPLLERPLADFRTVNPGYFAAMGIPLTAGRDISFADEARRVAVLSESAARRLWPGASAVGRQLRLGGDSSPLIDIVGVAGDVLWHSLDKPAPLVIYLPYWQRSRPTYSIAMRTPLRPESLEAAARARLRALDAELPIPAFESVNETVASTVAARRFQLALLLAFAAVALLLAATGIYGVVSYGVLQRRTEIGVRLALGATPAQVRRQLVARGLTPVAVGLAVGLLSAAGLARLLQSLLYGIQATDTTTYASAAAVLALVAWAACALPARSATRLDPVTVLRFE